MRTDYKIVMKSKRTDFTEVHMRVYEGDITTEQEDGEDVTRYRRTGVVTRPRADITALSSRLYGSHQQGNLWVLQLHPNQDVEDTLNRILAQDVTRGAIDEQVVR